ncbi:hypothetical protein E4U10_006368, partial [Claviceps purpurea]
MTIFKAQPDGPAHGNNDEEDFDDLHDEEEGTFDEEPLRKKKPLSIALTNFPPLPTFEPCEEKGYIVLWISFAAVMEPERYSSMPIDR